MSLTPDVAAWPATATAARAVQQRKKLTVDGLIGADTWPAVWQI